MGAHYDSFSFWENDKWIHIWGRTDPEYLSKYALPKDEEGPVLFQRQRTSYPGRPRATTKFNGIFEFHIDEYFRCESRMKERMNELMNE